MKKTVFLPTPLQKPRIPIWVGGFWPRAGPFRRAARWDGVIPLVLPERLPRPTEIREILSFIGKLRRSTSNLCGGDQLDDRDEQGGQRRQGVRLCRRRNYLVVGKPVYHERLTGTHALEDPQRASEARECSVEGEAHPKASGVRARLGHANHRDPEKLMTIRRGMGRRAKRRLVPNRTD